ncbi:hypothetical protein [Pseudovibrio japonicus]|nr:hypothetical protein [Pseudovibrio japonicus]
MREELPKVFVFVGPEKTGTTTIFDLLPFTKTPKQKEMFNLSRRRDMRAEETRIKSQILANGEAYIVEPTYFVSDFAREALVELGTRYDLKVIHTRRDPLERTVSHYLHHKAKGRVSNPIDAVSAYPEVVEASRYEDHSAGWRDAVDQFYTVQITSGSDFAATLKGLGISAKDAGFQQSNQRMAPRSVVLARIASYLWQWLIALRLNRLVPLTLKSVIKNRIYYGGNKVEISLEERECLKRMLSTTA